MALDLAVPVGAGVAAGAKNNRPRETRGGRSPPEILSIRILQDTRRYQQWMIIQRQLLPFFLLRLSFLPEEEAEQAHRRSF